MRVNHKPLAFKAELSAYLALCEGLGTPRALTCSLLARNEQWDDLMGLSIEPSHYNDSASFADDYLVTKALSKNPRVPLAIDRAEVAVGKFYAAEEMCRETNLRLLEYRRNPHSAGRTVLPLISKIQGIIARILHSSPSRVDLNYCESKMRFGPGATTSCSGVVTQGRKFQTRTLDCTHELVGFRAFCLPHLWKQEAPDLRIRDYSKLTTVPKDAKTDRVICIEPDLNIYVQLGIGALIRKKLQRFGLDLDTQEKNQSFASRAWTDNLCTVDLSSASDTISRELVELLLPPNWVDLLGYARVPATQMPDGTIVTLHKWSSMGNGYTFELESLIFYAVALSVTNIEDWGDVVTFGDDIILPLYGYPALIETLTFLGFKVNQEKTFGTGLFHESCGTDWFRGVNVRPFFLRSDFHDTPTTFYLYANNARRWAHRRNGGLSCDARVLPFWLRCYSAVSHRIRTPIPEGVGDGGFVSDFDRACPTLQKRVKRNGWGGFQYAYRHVGIAETVDFTRGAFIASLRESLSQETNGRESLRGRYLAPQRRIGYSLEWPNLGPWL